MCVGRLPHSVPESIMPIKPTLLPLRRIDWAAICTLAGCELWLCGCNDPAVPDAKSIAEQELPLVRAEVLTVEPCVWPTIVRTQGSLFADEIAVVGAKVAGRVAEVHVELGDAVHVEAPLAALDRTEFQLQVLQAEAQLAQARAAVGLKPDAPVESLQPESAPPVREERALWDEARAKSERWQQLRTQNAVTEADLEQVVATEEVAAARYASALNSVNEKIAIIGVRAAELSLARQRLADAVSSAPFDGLVEQRHVAPGSFVAVGQPIVTLVRAHPLHFRGRLPERHARKLAIGQEVRLQIETSPEPRVVKVTRISPTLDELTRSLLFEAEVDNHDGRLRTGLFAEAAVVLDPDARALVVPTSAVTEFAGAEKVWAVEQGRSAERIVITGQRRGDLVEIVSGLDVGTVVLWNGDDGRIARIDSVPRDLPSASAQVAAQPAESADLGADSDAAGAEEPAENVGGP